MLVELAQEVEGTGFLGKHCTQYDYATTYGLIHHASTYSDMSALRTDTRQVMRSFVSTDGDRLDSGSGEALQAAGGLIGWTDLYSISTTE